ncbi:MAG: hypothetical protein AB1679_12780 [Actinomycetota bacterium]|jgi:multisubunit Na+/H+ antiporter MnhC subunit
MPQSITVHPCVSARLAQLRAIRSDERGEVTIERTVLTAVVIGLALVILVLAFPMVRDLIGV